MGQAFTVTTTAEDILIRGSGGQRVGMNASAPREKARIGKERSTRPVHMRRMILISGA
jgi:hypothetical protein